MALPTNQEIDNAIRTSNTGTDADRPIRSSTNELLKAFRQEIANTQQDLANKVNNSTFNTLAQVARTGNYSDLSGRPQQYGGTGQSTDGYMTQKAVTDELGNKADLVAGKIPVEQLPSSLASGVVFKGTWDATTNQDNAGNPLPATPINDGEYYIVNTAGTQFALTFAAGDWIIAVDGQWYKLEPDSTVSSVNGQTGTVVVDVGVTSVGVTVPTGLVVSNTPITSAGTIDIALAAGYKIPTEAELAERGVEPPAGWLEAGNETKYLAGDGTLKDIPSDTQSDYAQTNPSAPDYIKNKPALFSGSYDDLSGKPTIPTKTSELVNDSEFVTDASLADLEARVDAALTKTFTPWQPDVIGADVDETKYPQNPEGKGYEIVGLAQPAQWNALGKEVENGDLIVFDNDGMPKTLGEDVPTGDARIGDLTGWTAAQPNVSVGGLPIGREALVAVDKGAYGVGVVYDENIHVLNTSAIILDPTGIEDFSVMNSILVPLESPEYGQAQSYIQISRGEETDANIVTSRALIPGTEQEGGSVILRTTTTNKTTTPVTKTDFRVVADEITFNDNPMAYLVTVPSSLTSPGAVGQLAADANYIYFCYATDSWAKVPKAQDKVIVTANKTLTAADSGKLLIINADGITITLPANSDFNIDIAKMDEDFITIVECAGTDKFREGTATISVIRDVSITNSGIAGKEWLAIGAYEV